MRCGRTVWLIALVTLVDSSNAEDIGPGYSREMSRMIPMRDGVELGAWITKPAPLASRVPALSIHVTSSAALIHPRLVGALAESTQGA